MSNMQEEINQYYRSADIAPLGGYGYDEYKKKYQEKETLEERKEIIREMYIARYDKFTCKNKKGCRCACYNRAKNNNQAENFLFSSHTDGIQVSQYYKDREYKGDRIPRIVVVSLSAPKPSDPFAQNGAQPHLEVLNPHWRETLAMVRSLLQPFIAPENFPKPVRYHEDLKKNKDKEEVQKLFVHVRTAKCCSNADGKRQEPGLVYTNCGPYFSEELRILEPDVIVTQGNNVHWAAETHAFDGDAKTTPTEVVESIDHSIAHIVNLKHDSDWKVYWLRTYHPCYGRYYSWHAGEKIDCECNKVGAMRKNLVRYGEEIKKFMNAQRR